MFDCVSHSLPLHKRSAYGLSVMAMLAGCIVI